MAIIADSETFEVVTGEWFAKKKDSCVPCHSGLILCRLEVNVFPLLGNPPITNIAQVNNTIQLQIHMLKQTIDHHNLLTSLAKIAKLVTHINQ